jgi:hypothetical protein
MNGLGREKAACIARTPLRPVYRRSAEPATKGPPAIKRWKGAHRGRRRKRSGVKLARNAHLSVDGQTAK